MGGGPPCHAEAKLSTVLASDNKAELPKYQTVLWLQQNPKTTNRNDVGTHSSPDAILKMELIQDLVLTW